MGYTASLPVEVVNSIDSFEENCEFAHTMGDCR